jgi:nitroimidazol reductase NimA-like FMN-containing flavoprotein (pyridoxamine 5'-phosphate oxidase superfamily)
VADVEPTVVEELTDSECLRFLRDARLGRIALLDGEQPLVVPVNYALDGDAVVFGTASGSLLDRAATAGERDRVAFEIDAADSLYHEGWSVLVVGRLEHILGDDELSRVSRLPVSPWVGPTRTRWIRLVPSSRSGRRIRHG